MIKVLFVVKDMRLSSGVASYTMNYYRKLNGENIQFDFLIVSDVGSPYYEEIKNNGGRVYIMPSYKKKPFTIIPYLNNLFFNNRYDILHCNVLNSGSLILMAAKKYGVPVRILHSHATQTGDKKWKEIRNKLFCGLSLHYANYYFSCSHLAGDHLFGKNNYYVIPNAIDVDKYLFSNQQRIKIRKEEKCDDKLVIMTVGRFTRQKNPFFIVDIVEALSHKNDNFILWWFGNGELEKSVMHYAKEKKVEKYIKFWGANMWVNEYYSAADVFILPSLYEGLPVVGIEAQISSLPVLFSNQITKETQITKEVKFLPIDDSKIWSENIDNYKNFREKRTNMILDFNEYKIEEQCIKLEKIYQSILDKHSLEKRYDKDKR